MYAQTKDIFTNPCSLFPQKTRSPNLLNTVSALFQKESILRLWRTRRPFSPYRETGWQSIIVDSRPVGSYRRSAAVCDACWHRRSFEDFANLSLLSWCAHNHGLELHSSLSRICYQSGRTLHSCSHRSRPQRSQSSFFVTPSVLHSIISSNILKSTSFATLESSQPFNYLAGSTSTWSAKFSQPLPTHAVLALGPAAFRTPHHIRALVLCTFPSREIPFTATKLQRVWSPWPLSSIMSLRSRSNAFNCLQAPCLRVLLAVPTALHQRRLLHLRRP